MWGRLAEDAAAPHGCRDEARRRMVETRRAAQGLPARDRAEHRAELPALPAPACVLHVVPRGDDAVRNGRKTTSAFAVSPLTPALSPEYRGEGVEAAPLATLAGARNAVRRA
jgi:hypothetical protein